MTDLTLEKRTTGLHKALNPIYEQFGINTMADPFAENKVLKAAFQGRDFKNLNESDKPIEEIAAELTAYLTANPPAKPRKTRPTHFPDEDEVKPEDKQVIDTLNETARALSELPGVTADFPLDHSSESDNGKDGPSDAKEGHVEVAGNPVPAAPETPPPAASSQTEPPKLSEQTKPVPTDDEVKAFKDKSVERVRGQIPDASALEIANILKKAWGYDSAKETLKELGEPEALDELERYLLEITAPPIEITDDERQAADKNPPPQEIDLPDHSRALATRPAQAVAIPQPSSPATTWFKTLTPADFTYADYMADLAIETRLFATKFASKAEMKFVIIKGMTYGFEPTASLEGFDIMPDGHGGKTIFMRPKLLKAVMEEKKLVRRFEVAGDDNKCTVVIQAWNHETPNVFTYSMEDAKKQKLAGKDNWTKMPGRMLMWRAIGIAIDAECPQARFVVGGSSSGETSGPDSTSDMTPDELEKSVALVK